MPKAVILQKDTPWRNLTDIMTDHLVYLPHQVHEGICGLHLLNSAFSVKVVLRSFSWVYDDHHEDANENSYDCGHHVVDDSPHPHLPWDSAIQWGHSWSVRQRNRVRKPIVLERKGKLEEDSKAAKLMCELDRELGSLGRQPTKNRIWSFRVMLIWKNVACGHEEAWRILVHIWECSNFLLKLSEGKWSPPCTLSLSVPKSGRFQQVEHLAEILAVCPIFLEDLGETSPPASTLLD